MKICAYCGAENREGAGVCVRCGKELTTKTLIDPLQEARDKYPQPTAPNEPELSLMIRTKQGLMPLMLPYGQRVHLGRSDSASQTVPEVDLMVFSAMEAGISRLHAVIDYTREGPTIADLGSSNGTFLNGRKLEPNQPEVMRYGDEVRLGRLVVYVYIQ